FWSLQTTQTPSGCATLVLATRQRLHATRKPARAAPRRRLLARRRPRRYYPPGGAGVPPSRGTGRRTPSSHADRAAGGAMFLRSDDGRQRLASLGGGVDSRTDRIDGRRDGR